MAQTIGVRLRMTEQIHHFDTAGIDLKPGDDVVVETAQGLELGKVVNIPNQIAPSPSEPLKPVLRKAGTDDAQQADKLKEREREAFVKSRELILKRGLAMKPVAAKYALDGRRLTIFFSTQTRVDFRELLRELASTLKTKVTLRQVGPRDEARLVGGMGRCGRLLCCGCFLCEFTPVSIKMAKVQDLSLNPVKISGVCGRLLCCLAYEHKQYVELKEKLPKVGEQVFSSLGAATVAGGNPLKETVLLELESGAMAELPLTALKPRPTNDEATPEAKEIPRRRRRRKKRSLLSAGNLKGDEPPSPP